MSMKIHRYRAVATIGLVLATFHGGTRAQSEAAPGSIPIEAFVAEVLATHPEISAREADLDAGRHRVPQAGALPDPTIGLGVMNLPWGTFGFDQMDMTMKTLSVSQMFPAPGVRSASTELAERAVKVAEAEMAGTREGLARRARLLYLDLLDTGEALRIVAENRALLETFIQIAESRYRIGAGLQQDILRARLEHSRLTERTLRLETRQAIITGAMNILRDHPAEEQIITAPLPEQPDVTAAPDALFRLAGTGNPRLRRAAAVVARNEAVRTLVERAARPGWGIGTSYAQRDGGRRDLVSATVTARIPLWSDRKQKRAIEEQEALVNRARHELRSLELEILDSIRQLTNRLEESRRLMALYTGEILPEAEGVLTSALAGYQVGQVDFLTLLSAQTTLFNYQLESIRVMTDHHRHRIELEAVLGSGSPRADTSRSSGT
jgi:outer membrane protein TolC